MNIQINCHSSIRIEDKKIMYFDPWKITGEPHDADIIFITHTHFDHFSPEDIMKICKPDTLLVCPESAAEEISSAADWNENNLLTLAPGANAVIDDITANAVPAYNIGKAFHKKEYGWCGYVIHAGQSYYVAGDTDATPELLSVDADVLLLPTGGKYTMDASEAAGAVNKMKAKLAIPTHYGDVAGGPDCGKHFAKQVTNGTRVELIL